VEHDVRGRKRRRGPVDPGDARWQAPGSGITDSNGPGDTRALLVKVDAQGNWPGDHESGHANGRDEEATSLVETTEGGYAVVGFAREVEGTCSSSRPTPMERLCGTRS
jgi:hypothetical protein